MNNHKVKKNWSLGRKPILFLVEILVSVLLVSVLFYVAFFVKLEAEVTIDPPRPFGQRDGYYGLTIAPDNSQLLWAAGRGGKIIHSNDSGVSWSIQDTPVNSHLQAVAAWNSKDIIAIGDRSVVLKSDDGGVSWSVIEIPEREFGDQLLQVFIDNNQRTWIVGRMGTVLLSTDQGISWQSQYPEEDLAFNGIASGGNDSIWVAGEFGQLKKYALEQQLWLSVDTNVTTSLMDVVFDKQGNGVAVGLSGTLLTSEDWGEHWQLAEINTPNHLFNVVVANQTFYVSGIGGILLTKSPQDSQWQQTSLGEQAAPWYTDMIVQDKHLLMSGANIARFTGQLTVFNNQVSGPGE